MKYKYYLRDTKSPRKLEITIFMLMSKQVPKICEKDIQLKVTSKSSMYFSIFIGFDECGFIVGFIFLVFDMEMERAEVMTTAKTQFKNKVTFF